MSGDAKDIGRLEGRMDALEKDVSEIRQDVKQLLQALSIGKGAWLLLMKLGAVVVVIGSVLAWIVDHIATWLRAH